MSSTGMPAIVSMVAVVMLRTRGWKKKYLPELVGYNSRLDELQAAILRVKLRHLEAWNEARRRLAAGYDQAFAGTDIVEPREAPGSKHVYHLYVIAIKGRDQVQRFLKERGIASAVYYPQPVHALEACRSCRGTNHGYPGAERCVSREPSDPAISRIDCLRSSGCRHNGERSQRRIGSR